MARTFGSFAEAAAAVGGWRARNAASAAARARREAQRTDPEHQAVLATRRAIAHEGVLMRAVEAAEERLARLHAALEAAKRRAEELRHRAYATADVDPGAIKIKATIEELPHAIARAEDELITANRALADHRARHAAILAPASAAAPTTTKRRKDQ